MGVRDDARSAAAWPGCGSGEPVGGPECGLAAMQRLLGRLVTDASLRGRFRVDPRGVGRELGLAQAEADRLASSLDPASIEEFARSLVAKRANEVADLLPLTRRVLGPRFRERFAAFARSGAPRGLRKHADDAVAFARHLRCDAVTGRCVEPEWLADLAHYEASWRESSDPARRVIVRVFRHPVRALADALARGESPASVRKRLSVCVWWRPTGKGRGRFFELQVPGSGRAALSGGEAGGPVTSSEGCAETADRPAAP